MLYALYTHALSFSLTQTHRKKERERAAPIVLEQELFKGQQKRALKYIYSNINKTVNSVDSDCFATKRQSN